MPALSIASWDLISTPGYVFEGPSRPGELHPEPLTDPDVNLSIHPARATPREGCRLPPGPGVPPVTR
jgi:hypothetical protein